MTYLRSNNYKIKESCGSKSITKISNNAYNGQACFGDGYLVSRGAKIGRVV